MKMAAARQTRRHRGDTLHDGRDEMNLVEFPFATLSERSGDTKVLEFQTEAYDRIIGKPVARKLTVTGDAKYGLPTGKDEEVYLGLLQLTKLHNDFSDSRVYFTRNELIRLMGWKNRDWSYHRITKAFCRLTGVRLFYENAWRDNAKKQFRSQGGFGLLDSFELRDGRVRSSAGDKTERLSEFRWSSVVFESFQSGYLKKLDYAKVRELGTIARRIYRYLDKHFHPPHRATVNVNLKNFACEHIGVSRSNDSSQLRRALTNPIRELESIGFLVPDKRRFKKILGRRGEWEIVFSLAGHSPRRKPRSSVAAAPKREIETHTKRPDKLDRYLESLPIEKRLEIESQAMQHASGFLLETLASHKGGPLADECRIQIIKAFVTNMMGTRRA